VEFLIKILQIILILVIMTIVADNNVLFAMVKGNMVTVGIVLCFVIIALKIQMRIK